MNFKNLVFYNKCGFAGYLMLPSFLLCFLSCKRPPEISNATVNYSHDSKGLLVISMKNGKSFIIDTGADASLIFSDRIKINSSARGLTQINNKKIFFIRKIDSLQICGLSIKNHNFVFMKADSSFWKNDTNIAGLIGMDILSQKYCCFDVKNQTISFSDEKQQTTIPSLILSYKSPTQPLSDININGNIFKDVIFDTGFDCFLELLEEDRKKLNFSDSLQKEDRYDLFNNLRPVYFDKPDSLEINDVVFQSPKILYGQKHRLLGLKFATHWSSFLIDPFEKRIEFYL